MSVYQNIYSKIAASLPEKWSWFTLKFKFSSTEDHFGYSIDYGDSENRDSRESLNFTEVQDGSPNLVALMRSLRDEIAPKPLTQFTHIELTFDNTGNFDSVLGYGKPNWDISPRPWPDDITADSYTYTKAWPNGITKKRAAIMKDPRSLVGVRILPD